MLVGGCVGGFVGGETETEGELMCAGEVVDGDGVVDPIYDFFEDVGVSAYHIK
jgi:hypothetical protein